MAVAGAGSGTTPAGGTDLSSSEGEANDDVDVSAAGSGALNILHRQVVVFVRDVAVFEATGNLSLQATDAFLALASTGATIGTGDTTIGAAFALNSVSSSPTASTSFVVLEVGGASLSATSDVTLLGFESTALTGGGSGLAIALSFNLTLADVTTDVGFGDATVLDTDGAVLVPASSALDIIASSGTASFAEGDGFGVGAALTLVIADSSAVANPRIAVGTLGDVTISASSDLRNRAFSATDGSTATEGDATAPAGQVASSS